MSTIRAATVDDAAAIAATHVLAWREAYAHLLSPAFFDSTLVSGRADRWREQLVAASAGAHWVCEVDGAIVGFASRRAATAPDTPRPLELQGLYLLQHHQGSGLGRELLAAAIGTEPASLWVLADNPRAQAFYAKNGFAFDGRRELMPTWENLVEVGMTR